MDIFDVLWIIGYTSVLLSLLYKYLSWNFDYFMEQGIPGPTPIPFFGNFCDSWKKPWHEVELDRYQKYGRLYGTFEGRTPCITIGDPTLYRKILNKNFENFSNRPTINAGNEIFSKTLPTLNGSTWKTMREILNPAFTVDKIQGMCLLMEDTCDELLRILDAKIKNGARKIDMRKMTSAYISDVIGSVAFGTKLDCMRNSETEFFKRAINIFRNEKIKKPTFLIGEFLYPNLKKIIPGSGLDDFDYFAHFAKTVLEKRRDFYKNYPNEKKRGDFIDILLDSSTKNYIMSNDSYVIAQICLFLIGGFEPLAVILALGLNCLALNLEIQEKIRNEIMSATSKCDGKLTRETINSLQYLDQCVSEIIRLYGPAIKTERLCNRSTNYGSIKIRRGVIVSIPIYAIHHDPQFYPDPFKFDPDRFSPDQQIARDPMTYIPFGAGKRDCIASVFALELIKFTLARLVQQFKFNRVFETSDPPSFTTGSLHLLQPKNVIIGFEKISK